MSRISGQRRRIDDHRAAVLEFVTRASALNSAQWVTPRASGKWTPAQETRHVILAYESFVRDLTGGERSRLKGNPIRRLAYRWIGLSSILWFGRIPVAVRAPRVSRPPDDEAASAAELLPLLRRRAEEFDSCYATACEHEPARRIMHPFFGALSLDQAIRLMSVHTRHHAAFLPKPHLTSTEQT
jgi:hypothetical protein